MRRGQLALSASLGFLVLCLALLTRNTGIHIDESSYVSLAAFRERWPCGETVELGKPCTFYFINFYFYRWLGPLFGFLQPLCLHLLNCATVAVTLAWLSRSRLMYAGLLLSPFIIFNSTQVMMETPILPLLAMVLVAIERPEAKWSTALLIGASAFAVLIKETAIPALAVIALSFAPGLRKRLWPLGVGAAAGWAVNKAILVALEAPDQRYGSAGNLLGLSRFKLAWVFHFGLMWLFYVWPPVLAAAGWAVWKNRLLKDEASRPYLLMTAASLAGTLLLALVSTYEFVRYAYPIVFLGVVAVWRLAQQAPHKALFAAIALYALPLASMWGIGGERFTWWWPRVITKEVYFSGYTVLPGVPIHGWTATHPHSRRDLCVFIPAEAGEKPWAVSLYFKYAAMNARFFDEKSAAAWEQCPGPKAVVRRQYLEESAGCGAMQCPVQTGGLADCTLQPMRSCAERKGSTLTNLTCLPR